MIRRSTWILLVILALVLGAYFYLTNRKAQQTANATPTAASTTEGKPLFDISQGNPVDISVKDSTGKNVEIARNGSGAWVLKAPIAADANQGSAEAAATQVTSLRVLANPQLGFDVVGLSKPDYTIVVKFITNKSHTLTVGALTPIQDGYYASLDNGPVQIVDKPGLDVLIGLLSQPPYAATPTPPVTTTPTETLAPATPTAESTGTAAPSPAASATSTP